MKLSEYRKTIGVSQRAAASQIVCHYREIQRWEKGELMPNQERQKQIYSWSGGAVTPCDWVDFPGASWSPDKWRLTECI